MGFNTDYHDLASMETDPSCISLWRGFFSHDSHPEAVNELILDPHTRVFEHKALSQVSKFNRPI